MSAKQEKTPDKWSKKSAVSSEEHAAFYAEALSLAVRIKQPFIAAYHIAIGVLVVMAIAVVVFWCEQVRSRVLPVQNISTALLTPHVRPGGKVTIHFDLDRVAICPVDISSSIIDGNDDEHTLAATHREIVGPIGRDHFNRSYTVPLDAALGHARLRLGWAYQCPGNYSETLSPLPLSFPDFAFLIDPAS